MIRLEGGKYEFYIDEITGSLMCKRYSSPWRQFVGDKAVRALFQHAEALQAQIDRLMLEHCPDEMTPEQYAEWSRNQSAVKCCGGECGLACAVARDA